MNYIDLFSGIGGFALGAYWAGMKFENHYFSEVDKYCIELYQKRFPDAIALGDITKIDTSKLPKGEYIISGGFPCQDISIAGKGAGIHGKRSGLWFEYWRIINDLRPKFAIMENVGMLIHRGLSEVLGSLAEIGYNAEWQDIRAEDMGAPHKRERIWIVAYTTIVGCKQSPTIRKQVSEEIGRAKLNKRNNPQGKFPNAGLFRQAEHEEQTTRTEQSCKEIPDAISKHDDYSGSRASEICRERPKTFEIQKCFSDASKSRLEREKSKSKFSGRKSGLFAECNWWSIEPDVGRLAHGVSNRVDRLKGLGNAIVPQIAELLFRQIKVYL